MRLYKYFLICSFIAFSSYGQSNDTTALPKLFFDCKADFCDLNYFRQELPYINFVIDRRLSDIYVLMTSQQTGNGGNAFYLYFFDNDNPNLCKDTLIANVPDNTSESETRLAILKELNAGLLPYLIKSPLRGKINYSIDFKGASVQEQSKNDKWNFWSFNVRANGNGSVDANYKNYNANFSFSIDRVTDKYKFNSGHYSGLTLNRNKIDDTTFSSNQQYYGGFYNNLTISINDHWAYGYYCNLFRSTFDNYFINLGVGPAVEYNLFSVKEATRRQLRFINRFALRYNDYFKPTIFDKKKETRWVNSFMIVLSEIEKWGSFNARFGYFQYLHNIKVFRLSILPEVQINILKGLSIELSGSASWIRDQINLANIDASSDDIILRRNALASNFNFNGFIGFSYRFGSKYNNVINPRFDLPDDFY